MRSLRREWLSVRQSQVLDSVLETAYTAELVRLACQQLAKLAGAAIEQKRVEQLLGLSQGYLSHMVALRRLLPSSLLLDPTGDVATIVESRPENVPWLQVQLRRTDGSLKGEKSFRSEGSCFDVAELVATVIATWEPDLQQVNSSRPRPSAIMIAIGLGVGVTLYEGTAIAGSIEGVVDWGARPWGGA